MKYHLRQHKRPFIIPKRDEQRGINRWRSTFHSMGERQPSGPWAAPEPYQASSGSQAPWEQTAECTRNICPCLESRDNHRNILLLFIKTKKIYTLKRKNTTRQETSTRYICFLLSQRHRYSGILKEIFLEEDWSKLLI